MNVRDTTQQTLVSLADVATRRFYDELAPCYDEGVLDWAGAVSRQAEALSAVLAERGVETGGSILDLAVGIGTQALGLVMLGYAVEGIDVSAIAVARARQEAASRGLVASFSVADMRTLGPSMADAGFDAVICCDNSITHMLEPEDLEAAMTSARLALRGGGVLAVSTRDYDRHLTTRPAATAPLRHPGRNERVTYQLWDWIDDTRYRARLFVAEDAADGWQVRCYSGAVFRAWTREELATAARRAGFIIEGWLMPAQSGYHQPMLIARG